jgi:hypothetical protein
MKYTLATFLAALTLLTVAIALPRKAEPDIRETPLDLEGIEEVRVVGTQYANFVFADTPPNIAWPTFDDADVQFRREGAVLVIEAGMADFRRPVVTLPPRISRVVFEQGDIETRVPVPSLHVTAENTFTWRGDAGRLVIVDLARLDCGQAGEEPCVGGAIHIYEGTIRELDVTAADSNVMLQDASSIGQATLRLAPRATFALDNARSTENIHVILLDAAGQEQPTDTTVGFASDNDVPPAGDDPNDKND